MKVPQKAKMQINPYLNLGRKRQNSILGKSVSAEKLQQDELILD